MSNENKIRVLYVQPGKYPEERFVANELRPFSSLSLGSGLYFFRPQSPRKKAHSLLRYFGIRGICITSLPAARFANLLLKIEKRPTSPELFAFGAILDVFI